MNSPSETTNFPRVSCVVAVYNGETYLSEAIDSLLAQTYPNLEIVVVNDGSTDGTADVIRRFGDRLRLLHQANHGVSIARNRGVELSSGELLCFLDADDRVDPRKLTMQVAELRADPNLDFCDCHTSNFWSPELSAETREQDPRYRGLTWWKIFPAHLSTWLFRRDLWDRVGGFQPRLRYAEDFDWFSRACDLPARRVRLADVLTYRRLHPGNVSARCLDEQSTSVAGMLKAHLARKRSASPGGPKPQALSGAES
jgi:glycosyltransferase involved in cell wall biosynthesis